MKPVALVVVAHNSAEPMREWLAAVHRSGLRDRLELCVVDSGSAPAQRDELAAAVGSAVDVLLQLPNVGFGRACNAGAAATRAPALVFTNPDTSIEALPPRVWDEPDLRGRIVGAVAREDGATVPLGYEHLPTAWWEARQMLLGRWTAAYRQTGEDPAWVLGAALAISRADFDRIGGFSPSYFLYFEDADLCARHREGGGTVEVDPGFVVRHAGGASSSVSAELDTLSRLSGRTYAGRHGGRLHRAMLYGILLAYYVPRRVAMVLLRGGFDGAARRRALQVAFDLARPGRVLRRLGAADARRAAR